MPDAFDSSIFGPDQVPFVYEHPGWLAFLEPEPGELSSAWLRLVAQVANVGNESGFSTLAGEEWRVWPGYGPQRSRWVFYAFEKVGALRLSENRWYVVGWRDTYRVPDPA